MIFLFKYSLIVYQSTRNFMLIPKMYVFISLPWIFVELHFKSRRFHVNFDYFTIWTNSGRNIRPISENIANWSLFAFSSFFLNRFSQKWRPLYGQNWQMAALNSIRMTNLDESGREAICDVIFCRSKNHLSDPRN